VFWKCSFQRVYGRVSGCADSKGVNEPRRATGGFAKPKVSAPSLCVLTRNFRISDNTRRTSFLAFRKPVRTKPLVGGRHLWAGSCGWPAAETNWGQKEVQVIRLGTVMQGKLQAARNYSEKTTPYYIRSVEESAGIQPLTWLRGLANSVRGAQPEITALGSKRSSSSAPTWRGTSEPMGARGLR